jgi:hypothetical protein
MADRRTVCVFPRSSKTRQIKHSDPPVTGKRRRDPLAFTLEAIEQYYDVAQADAANELGVSVTTMKQICRRLGIGRWPYRRPKLVKGSQGRRSERQDASSEGAGTGGAMHNQGEGHALSLSSQASEIASSEGAGTGGAMHNQGEGHALSLSSQASEIASSASTPCGIPDALSRQSTSTTLGSRSFVFHPLSGQAQVDPSIAPCREPLGFPVRPTHIRPASSTSHQSFAGDVSSSPRLLESVPPPTSMRSAGYPAGEMINHGDGEDFQGLLSWLPPPQLLPPRAHAQTYPTTYPHIPGETVDGYPEEDGDYPLYVCW